MRQNANTSRRYTQVGSFERILRPTGRFWKANGKFRVWHAIYGLIMTTIIIIIVVVMMAMLFIYAFYAAARSDALMV